jgi:hypothetical protein
VTPYASTGQPGDFRGSNPVNQTAPFVRPFALTSAAQFRAEGPPALSSQAYAADVAETQAWGGKVSALRTDDQLQNARFHTEPPPSFWTRNLRPFAWSQPSLLEDARAMAMLWVAQADVTVACFESKYHFRFWRPTSAITLADTDGNPRTQADSTWEPAVPTPNHPEYPAAHACATGAATEMMKAINDGKKKLSFSFDSTVTGQTHAYTSVDDLVREVQLARIHGGMHFRTGMDHGRVVGMKVAKWIDHNHFQPVKAGE